MAQKDSDYSNVTPLSDIIDAFTSLTGPKIQTSYHSQQVSLQEILHKVK